MIYNFNSVVRIFDINDLIILKYSKKSNKRIINLVKSSIKDKLINNYNKYKIRFLDNRNIINIKIENLFLVYKVRINNRYE